MDRDPNLSSFLIGDSGSVEAPLELIGLHGITTFVMLCNRVYQHEPHLSDFIGIHFFR